MSPNKKSSFRFIGRYSVIVLVSVAIFMLGWGLGSGRITADYINKLQSENATLPKNLDYSSVEQVYDEIKQNYDGKLTTDTLLNGIKHGLSESTGDPYTEYLNAKETKDFDDSLNGTFSGIGAELGKDAGSIVVVSPITGYPAQKAGLKSKDVIVSIDDKPASGMTISQAVDSIRGPSGSTVKLQIARDGKELNFEIVRETIKIPSVESKIINGNIGYMKITTFSEETADLAEKSAQEFKNKGVKGVIIDVRGNPGGLLNSAVSLGQLWISEGKVILTERRGGEVIKTHTSDTSDPILKGIPTVVLIDGGSASASEILAGALKDNKAATLMGEKSYGKGSVQNLIQIPSGGVLKVTIARWYTPAGRNIDKQGIVPDKKIKFTDEDIKTKQDPQKDAAVRLLQGN
jgi:carboxyl-terminal processing protease